MAHVFALETQFLVLLEVPPGSSPNDELHSKQHKPNSMNIRPELAFHPAHLPHL